MFALSPSEGTITVIDGRLEEAKKYKQERPNDTGGYRMRLRDLVRDYRSTPAGASWPTGRSRSSLLRCACMPLSKRPKTAAGAVWLNADLVSPYDYWQYWRNTEDADVGRFLRLFTDLPLGEIHRLAK